jgi:hypothetical protein
VRLLQRLNGTAEYELHAEAPLILNPDIERPLKGLQVLFAHNLSCLSPDAALFTSALRAYLPWLRKGLQVLFARRLTSLAPAAARLTAALRAYHPWLLHARCEIDCTNPDAPFGLAGWDDHVIKVVGFTQPLPMDVTARCVKPAHYAPEYKRLALAHQAHVQLYYAGFASSPLEQYVALAVVAGALATCGAVGVLNENARTSMPGEILAARDYVGDRLELLRTLPITTLYAGFVKYEVGQAAGLWMRTHGCELLGLPDLAFLASAHHEGERVFELFASVLNHLLITRERLAEGDTLQLGVDWNLRARRPWLLEAFLENDGDLLVLETIMPSEINQ